MLTPCSTVISGPPVVLSSSVAICYNCACNATHAAAISGRVHLPRPRSGRRVLQSSYQCLVQPRICERPVRNLRPPPRLCRTPVIREPSVRLMSVDPRLLGRCYRRACDVARWCMEHIPVYTTLHRLFPKLITLSWWRFLRRKKLEFFGTTSSWRSIMLGSMIP